MTKKSDDFIDHSLPEGRGGSGQEQSKHGRRCDGGESPLGLINAAIPHQSRWWQNKLLLVYEPHLVDGDSSYKKQLWKEVIGTSWIIQLANLESSQNCLFSCIITLLCPKMSSLVVFKEILFRSHWFDLSVHLNKPLFFKSDPAMTTCLPILSVEQKVCSLESLESHMTHEQKTEAKTIQCFLKIFVCFLCATKKYVAIHFAIFAARHV